MACRESLRSVVAKGLWMEGTLLVSWGSPEGSSAGGRRGPEVQGRGGVRPGRGSGLIGRLPLGPEPREAGGPAGRGGRL